MLNENENELVSYEAIVEERKVDVKRQNLTRVNISKMTVEQKLKLLEDKKLRINEKILKKTKELRKLK